MEKVLIIVFFNPLQNLVITEIITCFRGNMKPRHIKNV